MFLMSLEFNSIVVESSDNIIIQFVNLLNNFKEKGIYTKCMESIKYFQKDVETLRKTLEARDYNKMVYDEKLSNVKNYEKNPPKDNSIFTKAKEELNFAKEQYESKNKFTKSEINKLLKKQAKEYDPVFKGVLLYFLILAL
jgi:hypothetical protein